MRIGARNGDIMVGARNEDIRMGVRNGDMRMGARKGEMRMDVRERFNKKMISLHSNACVRSKTYPPTHPPPGGV